MRSGFLAFCGFLALLGLARAQGTAPTIVTYPAPATAMIGERVTLTATVTGSLPIQYQWFKDGVQIPDATNASLTLPFVMLADSGLYRLDATNTFGSATTFGAVVYVTKRPQTITFNAPASSATGSGLTLAATASSGLPVSFDLVSGTATLNGNNLVATTGSVVVRATQAGDATYDAAESVERTITFLTGAITPFLTSPPLDQTVVAGNNVTFRVSAIGTPLPTYQWQKDGVDLPGANGNTLTLSNVTLADAGRYSVSATNAAGVATGAATLTVQVAPFVTTQPADTTVAAGGPAQLKVGVTAVPAAQFQWRKNGTNIAGATRDTLAFANVAVADAARYDVVVTNSLGSVTSTTATLTVNVRDFAGTYLGRIDESSANPGQFALVVRANRSAVFLARLPGNTTAVETSLTVDLSGNFSVNTAGLGSATATQTIRGTIDEVAGTVTGTVGTSATRTTPFAGTRAAGSDTTGGRAGFYTGAALGTAAARAFAVVASSGDTLVVVANPTGVESVQASLTSAGRFLGASPGGTPIDLTFGANAMRGTVGAAPNTVTLLGAIEGVAGTERLANVSVRTNTSNASPLILGFVIRGSGNKQVLLRAAGPAIAAAPFNVAGALNDPTLQVFRGNTSVANNDDWGSPNANRNSVNSATTRTGAFPFANNSNDAAISTTLQAAAYTAQIGGGNGIVLAEVYEDLANNEAPGARRLVNVSARGQVAPGSPLIAGFVINGTAPRRVLVRGIGQTIGNAPFNVPNNLNNPQLTIFRGTTSVKANDDWFRDADAALIRDTSARVGAFALGAQSVDAAVLLYLEPGAYTAQVSGPANANANNGTGVALVEVYDASDI